MAAPPRPPPVLPYLLTLTLLIAAVLLRDTITLPPRSEKDVEEALRHELTDRVASILRWRDAHHAFIEELADHAPLRAALARPAPDRRGALEDVLSQSCASLGGCAVLTQSGVVLAARRMLAVPEPLVERASRGRTVHSQLIATDDPTQDTTPRAARRAVFFATPLMERGVLRAILVTKVHPDEELGPLLTQRARGRTGETYAVDRAGYMITRSRFDRQGRHPEHAPLVLGTPATWLRTPRDDAPTRAFASLRRPGLDVDGYIDYRGVRVVGAWRWLDDLGAGIITEMDVAEAYHVVAIR